MTQIFFVEYGDMWYIVSMRWFSRLMLMCLAAFLMACGVCADTWDGGPGGTGTDWHLDENWADDTKPVYPDTAYINLDGANVIVTQNEYVSSLSVGSSAGNQTLTIQSGYLAVSNGVVIGGGAGAYAKLYVNGGTICAQGGSYMQVGQAGSCTGILIQTGGNVLCYGRDLRVGGDSYYAHGEYYLMGGMCVHSNNSQTFRMGMRSNSVGRFYISGGSLHIHRADVASYDGQVNGNVMISVIGSGCTNITIGAGSAGGGSGFDYDDGDEYVNTLQAFIDPGGLSTIKSWGTVDLRNVNLEIGITNKPDFDIGTKFEFLRTTNAATLYTTGLVVSNLSLDEGWEFGASTDSYGGYDWLIITLLNRPPKATAIMIK